MVRGVFFESPQWRPYNKWVVLWLTSMVTFGGYYSFDFPSVLHNQLYRYFHSQDHTLSLADYELSFSLLFSLYSFPNTVLPWIGGVLSDKIGNNTMMFAMASLVLLGNFIQTYAIWRYDMQLLLFGRFLFGLGAETLQVCTNTTISKWFHSTAGQELAFALGINLSACKLAGVLTDWMSPYIESQHGIVISSVVVSLVCLLCFVLTLFLVKYEPEHVIAGVNDDSNSDSEDISMSQHAMLSDKHTISTSDLFDEKIHLHLDDFTASPPSPSSHHSHGTSAASRDLTKRTIRSGANGGNAVDKTLYYQAIQTQHDEEGGIEMTSSSQPSQHNHLHHHKATNNGWMTFCYQQGATIYQEMCHLNSSVWLMLVLTFFMYGTFIPFSNISNAVILEIFFAHKDPKSSEIKAAYYQSIPYFLTVFLNPILGLAVDYVGHRTMLLFCAATTLMIAHTLIYTAAMGAVVPLLCIGVAYSIFGSVIWPCVPVVVEEKLHGTAYGTMAAFQNTGQFIVPLILQGIFRAKSHFRDCELFLIASASMAMVIAAWLYYNDHRHFHGILSKPSI